MERFNRRAVETGKRIKVSKRVGGLRKLFKFFWRNPVYTLFNHIIYSNVSKKKTFESSNIFIFTELLGKFILDGWKTSE
jgi:hypothetical protein